MKRCTWSINSPLEQQYHDQEWGVPLHDDRMLFEMLILESAQSGLSWALILNKREGYRRAFDQFDAVKIEQYDERKVAQLMQDAGIIRNKLKINATIENAKQFLRLQQQHGSFDAYIWSYVNHQPIDNAWQRMQDVPAITAESEAMSKGLKKEGFKFLGPTTCYAFMQATGMVNDHLTCCFRYNQMTTT